MRNQNCCENDLRARCTLETLENRRLLSGDIETIGLDVGATPESVIFADFNGDEVLDTAVLAPSLGQIQIWSPDEAGGFDLWATIEGDFDGAQRLQVLDTNGDGIADIGFFDSNTQRFTAYENAGQGSFDFAGGLQLADTASGFIFLYHGEGPAGEPVGPWVGPQFGEDDEGFGDGDEGDGHGDGGHGDGGHGDGGHGGDGDGHHGNYAQFQGDPFMLVWHESLGAVELVDSHLLLPEGDSSEGDSSGDGTGDGTDDGYNIVPWPFEGSYIDLPGGVYFEAGSGGDAVAISDLNNDGELDLALTNRNDGTITIAHFTRELEAQMHEGYDPTTDGLVETTTVEVGGQPVHINVFDTNRDGFQDLLVSDAENGKLATVFGSSTNSYEEITWTLVDEGLTQAFINFHSFGNDLFVLGFSASGSVTELRFEADGLEVHKQETDLFVANTNVLPRQIVVGEFTGDGCTDVAVIDQAGGAVKIYVNVDCHHGGDDHEDNYDGPPFDQSDIPVPGIPDLLPDYDTGDSDSDNITVLNNTGGHTLKFSVDLTHISEELAELKATAEAFFEENGEQYDEDGFQYLPKAYMNIYSGDVFVGSAEIDVEAESVTVETDGFTVFREGVHKIRAGIVLGAPGLRGLLGTRSVPLEIDIRTPNVEVDTSGGDDGETATITKDAEGNHVLVLEREDGDGEQINLGSIADVPQITGSVVTMKEGKTNGDTSRYAAGQSDEGVVLFVRTSEGDWSGRNLTDEIPDSEPITDSNIEVLTTPWGNINMAGLNEDGEIVFYWQDGGVDENGEFRWNFVNLADGQLRPNGQSVPSYASSLESFVTPWGAMNVAGLDANGHLRVVWWAPSLNNWVSTDLTELLGATPLVGDISAYMTPWGGINLIGLNADSEMVAVWWAPGHEWAVTPIGDLLGAPTFVSGSITSFLSDRGDIFVGGITSDNAIGFFAWDRSDASWDFTKIELDGGGTLIGSASGYHTESTGQVTLLAGTLEGDIFEFVGDSFDEDDWTIGLYAA